jgi:hypothetical protein
MTGFDPSASLTAADIHILAAYYRAPAPRWVLDRGELVGWLLSERVFTPGLFGPHCDGAVRAITTRLDKIDDHLVEILGTDELDLPTLAALYGSGLSVVQALEAVGTLAELAGPGVAS